jgi:hypothetical protein
MDYHKVGLFCALGREIHHDVTFFLQQFVIPRDTTFQQVVEFYKPTHMPLQIYEDDNDEVYIEVIVLSDNKDVQKLVVDLISDRINELAPDRLEEKAGFGLWTELGNIIHEEIVNLLKQASIDLGTTPMTHAYYFETSIDHLQILKNIRGVVAN